MDSILKTILAFVDKPWKVAALVVLGFFGLTGHIILESRQQIVNVMIAPSEITLDKRTAEAIASDFLRKHRSHGTLAVLIYEADIPRNRRSIVACEYVSSLSSMERWCDSAHDLPIIGETARFLPLGVAVLEGKTAWIDSTMAPYGDDVEVSILAVSIPPARAPKRVGIINIYTRKDINSENKGIVESAAISTSERLVSTR